MGARSDDEPTPFTLALRMHGGWLALCIACGLTVGGSWLATMVLALATLAVAVFVHAAALLSSGAAVSERETRAFAFVDGGSVRFVRTREEGPAERRASARPVTLFGDALIEAPASA